MPWRSGPEKRQKTQVKKAYFQLLGIFNTSKTNQTGTIFFMYLIYIPIFIKPGLGPGLIKKSCPNGRKHNVHFSRDLISLVSNQLTKKRVFFSPLLSPDSEESMSNHFFVVREGGREGGIYIYIYIYREREGGERGR